MNFKTKICAVLFMTTLVFSCDELDKLTEFDVNDDFSTVVNVDITEDSNGMPQSWSESAVINIGTNSDISDNLNLIQNVKIKSLTYVIDNFVGADDATITEAMVSFNGDSVSIENINLASSDTNNTVYTISDIDLLNSIGSTLEDSSKITVSVSGTVSSTPVKFDVIFTIATSVTIDIL